MIVQKRLPLSSTVHRYFLNILNARQCRETAYTSRKKYMLCVTSIRGQVLFSCSDARTSVLNRMLEYTKLQNKNVFQLKNPHPALHPSKPETFTTHRTKLSIHRSKTTPISAAMDNESSLKRTLVSFDVDGTLIHSVGEHANKLHKEAFAQAFREVFDIDTTIDVIPHHGSTDPLILVKVLVHHGVPKDKAMAALPQMQEVMCRHFIEHAEKAGQGLEVLPGIVDVLEILKQHGVMICLVTGNMEPIGWAKMKALGIQDYFTGPPYFGGFGSDFCSGNTEESWKDRAELIRIAGKRAAALHSNDGGVVKALHIGDAPMDVQAAGDVSGVTAIGVTTGIYTYDQLRSVNPDAKIVERLQKDTILELLNL